MSRDTIYTLKLRRRGIDIDRPRATALMAQITVAEAMGKPRRPVRPDQPLNDLVKRFAAERSDSLPIIDQNGSLLGVIAAVDIERAISQSADQPPLAAALARAAPDLRADDSLEDAVHALGSTDNDGVPVLGDDHQLIGWLTHRRLLRAYRERSDEQQHTPIQP